MNIAGRKIARTILERVLERQGHICAYCLLPFGTVVWTPKRGDRLLAAEADHFIPWSGGGSNTYENCVAACQICNGMKGDKYFESQLDVQRYVLGKSKHRLTMFLPSVAITEDPDAWSRQYAEYLAA